MARGPATGFSSIHKEGKAQQLRHLGGKPPAMCSHLDAPSVDDYDPRRSEYVLSASPGEVDTAQADLLRKQVTSLLAAVKRRRGESDEAPHVIQHYELTMGELSSALKDGKLHPSIMPRNSSRKSGPDIMSRELSRIRGPDITSRDLSRISRTSGPDMCPYSSLSPPLSPVLSPLHMEEQWMEDDEIEEQWVENDLVTDLDATETMHVLEHQTKVTKTASRAREQALEARTRELEAILASKDRQIQDLQVATVLNKDSGFVSQRAKGSIFDCLVFGCFPGLSRIGF